MLPLMYDEESRRFTAMAMLVLGMPPSLKKKATVGQSNAWRAQRHLRLHHACMKYRDVVDSIKKFCSTDSHIMCADGKVVFFLYIHDLSHTYLTHMPDIGTSMLGLSTSFWVRYAWTVQRSRLLVCVPKGSVHAVGVPIPYLM
jgi:hypothetical protein